jgi:protein SCO1/2
MIEKTLSQNLIKTIPFFLSLLLLTLTSCTEKTQSLPYLGEHSTAEIIRNNETISDTSYYQVPEFELINQDSMTFTQEEVEGKVYVSYFFFTSCPATCPVMTDAMKRVYKVVGDQTDFAVLAHTVDPKRDTPSKLTAFAHKNEIVYDNWDFLTADEAYIYDLGMHGYYLSMGKHDQAPGGFIHSSKFILLDRDRHIRGIYEGTNSAEVADMIKDIEFLLKDGGLKKKEQST